MKRPGYALIQARIQAPQTSQAVLVHKLAMAGRVGKRINAFLLPVLLAALLSACSTPQPKNINDVCAIFDEQYDWYSASKAVEDHYGIPIPVTMAFIHQESRFIGDNRPPRKWYFWIIPGGRPSTAYGYAQALDTTWREYQQKTGRWSADRDDFEDAVDFVGWYNLNSVKRAHIRPNDAYRLYLAYHEGAGGYLKGSYQHKKWLLDIARKVDQRARRYTSQLQQCRDSLDDGWFWRGLFGQAPFSVPLSPAQQAIAARVLWSQAG
ncbi:hypothetical protein [Candidatus Thalassolituus haligoni]|uniref:transglycosylase SLT domain-containing protein n=1 Tax=Candidatus Thalassolituus haligoni TaxID=3100113 RepID=UPI003516211C